MEETTRHEGPALDDELLEAVRSFLQQHFQKQGNPWYKAEEAAQEGVFKAWRNAPQWRGKCKLRSYLIGVGIKEGISYFRKEARQARIQSRESERVKAIRKRLYPNRRKTVVTLTELDNVKNV